uniref:Uncharacterized protein n=1 Tax=Arundo donax TaxID=35708 RepID=A0A0A9GBJ7_ARUDO
MSVLSGRSSGCRCRQNSARCTHSVAWSLSYPPSSRSSMSSSTLPARASCRHQLTRLAFSSFIGDERMCSGRRPDRITSTSTPKLYTSAFSSRSPPCSHGPPPHSGAT